MPTAAGQRGSPRQARSHSRACRGGAWTHRTKVRMTTMGRHGRKGYRLRPNFPVSSPSFLGPAKSEQQNTGRKDQGKNCLLRLSSRSNSSPGSAPGQTPRPLLGGGYHLGIVRENRCALGGDHAHSPLFAADTVRGEKGSDRSHVSRQETSQVTDRSPSPLPFPAQLLGNDKIACPRPLKPDAMALSKRPTAIPSRLPGPC